MDTVETPCHLAPIALRWWPSLCARNSRNYTGERLLAELRSAVDNADGHLLELAAHRMKGSAANLSARRVVALSGRLEELAHGGRLAAARSVFDELEREVGRLADALEVLKGPTASLAH